MVTLVLHTLREGQAAGFVLTTALARTEDSEGLDGGIRRRRGWQLAVGAHLLPCTPVSMAEAYQGCD